MAGKEEQIRTPSGMGGLTSYNEETNSKLQIPPEWIAIIISVVIVGIALIKIFLPIRVVA